MSLRSRPQKTDSRSPSIVVSDLCSRSGRTRSDERVCSTQDSATICGGGRTISCSTPTRATNPRRGEEDEEVESPATLRTEAEEMCSIIDPPMGLIVVKTKTFIHDEDAPPGFGFVAKPASTLLTLRSCPSAKLQVITNQKIFEDTLTSPVMEVPRFYLNSRRTPPKVRTSSVYANLYPGLAAREDELLSTASFNENLEDTDESDNDAASAYYVENDIVENEEAVSSSITENHDLIVPEVFTDRHSST